MGPLVMTVPMKETKGYQLYANNNITFVTYCGYL